MQTSQLLLIFVLIIISVILVNGFMDVKLIQDYFKEKHTNYATVIGCFKNREMFQLAKSLNFGMQTIVLLSINIVNDSMHFLKTTHNHVGVILDGDCDEETIKIFITQCGRTNCFEVKLHWLILTSNPNFSSTFDDVELYINADVNIVYRQAENNSTNYTIQDVYNPASTKGGELKTRTLGFYNEKTGYNTKEKEYKYWLRRNMTGVTLKSIVVLPVPYEETLMEYLISKKHLEINTFNRFHYDTLSNCVDYYNFTPKVTKLKSWGYLQGDGTFDGLVGQLERKRVDYGSSPLFVRADRGTVMEYGRQTWTLRAGFVFRNPQSVNSVQIFIKPFSSSVWMSLIFTSIIVLILFKCTYLCERRILRPYIETNWSYLMVNTVSVFCQQGIANVPFFNSARISVLLLLICSYLIYQFYSASIVSSLLMKPKTVIKSLEDILHSRMQVGCEDTLYTKDYLQHTTDEAAKELYLQKILGNGNTSNFLSAQEGIAMLKDGGYAFHVEFATAYPIIAATFSPQSVCELREINMYKYQPMHSNLQKYSPFRDMFDTCLQRLAEYGILNRQIQFWHPKRPECIHSAKILTKLSLEYFYPLLAMLLIGMVFSLIILVFEMYINFRQRVREFQKIEPLFPFIN